MANNFVNLFNNLTTLVATTRMTNMQNARQGIQNQLSVFMANIQGGANVVSEKKEWMSQATSTLSRN